MATGFVWHERYAWHDARGLLDTFDRSALFEPEPSLENGTTKRRLRNLVDASGLLDRLVKIQPRPATEVELARVHGRGSISTRLSRSPLASRRLRSRRFVVPLSRLGSGSNSAL